ncbi:hypothetical protein SAMN05660380_01991 [Xylella fastidiosa]|jgi:hypothetical protein|uniref:Uncharacterized protein n=1 Tax=Xylella fastidiosa (strain M23) TaxID=405441 RepID=B2IAE4_XYLF2|nr:hypothetical protein XfasM23_0785 [Xylella fastidiosa M23]SHH04351.1 hypothetical protein SAMN05660380_01991 [Xylella fastidiosa]
MLPQYLLLSIAVEYVQLANLRYGQLRGRCVHAKNYCEEVKRLFRLCLWLYKTLGIDGFGLTNFPFPLVQCVKEIGAS